MEITVGTAFAKGENNFDAIRLCAALLVLFSHSYSLTGHPIDPVSSLTGYHIDGGGLGVSVFFVISGFLVTRSVISRTFADYARARILRILPALTVVTFIQTFVIGSLFTTLPLGAYLINPATISGLRNALVFDLRTGLPGVFLGNPLAGWVNGSLWTLPVECSFYVFLPFLALVGVLRRNVMLAATILVFVALYPVMAWMGLSWAVRGPQILGSVALYPAVDCLAYFIMGATLWTFRDDVPLSGGLALCCLIALFASTGTVSSNFVDHVTIPYLTIFLALANPFTERWIRPIGDLSYGTYLYAFPIQQSLIELVGPGLGPLRLVFLSAPITLACAALSFRFVERPALRLKVRRQRFERVR